MILGNKFPESDNGAILSIINNVFLPPQLPSNGDSVEAISHDNALLRLVICALREFQPHVNSRRRHAVSCAEKSMVHFQNIRDDSGFIDEKQLAERLNPSVYRKDEFLPLHITAQNAGILITQNQDSVALEFFELSPTNEAAMSTAGRLQRCFPGSAISIPVKKFHETGFIEALAHTIETMSHQEVIEAQPKIVKKGEVQIEERDTTDPFLVTDYLSTVLLAQGGTSIQASSISKNTREEVIWNDAFMPWRRSPVWLLIRVTLQLHFERLHSDRLLYKEFMIFLMTYTLDIAQKRSFQSDILYCMMAKIAKRLKKLGDAAEVPWIRNIYEVLEQTRAFLQRRWALISQEPDANVELEELSGEILPTEGSEPYPNMDEFICSIGSRKNENCISRFKAPWLLRKYDQSSIPNLQNLTDESIPFHLTAFEKWVESSLRLWMQEDACIQLYELTHTYYNLSRKCYSGCPESLSIASLTILELWIACDESVCGQIPLVQEYSPQIPIELLESLLLHSKNHIERLARVEEYINKRCSGTLSGPFSIFSSFGHKHSFSVRYYAKSTSHKTLRKKIEDIATEERRLKRKEFYKKRQEYHDLISRSAILNCEFVKFEDRRTGRLISGHDRTCTRCELRHMADALAIEVHEWPLPSTEFEAQSTVFELDVPPCFSVWRNMTTLVINEVLECDYSGIRQDNVVDRLSTYLSSHFTGVGHRLELVSTTKSNKRTHRHGKNIKTCETEEDVLVKNGLRYEYYDTVRQCFVSPFTNKANKFSRRHMFKLSEQNNALQDFIFRPHGQENGLTPNHVLSQQSCYSQDLSFEESKSMASLPVGFRIQWYNILVQLFTPTVDFNKPDTVLIILQIIHQAGPPDNYAVYRASHQPLREESFVKKLLQGLSHSVNRIHKNWESYIALRGFIAIAIKALNCSPTESLMAAYRQFLGRCRSVAMSWVNLLNEKLSGIDDEKQRQEFYLIISQMAMICIASFDVDEPHLRVILSEAEQVNMLIRSSIIIKNLSHSVGECTDPFYTNLLLQKQRVLYNSHGFILNEILDKRNQGLSSAVKTTLPFYDEQSTWKLLSDAEYHWLETETINSNGQTSSFTQMNILTGELLINGLPPSRLPGVYEEHPIFKALFGREMIEVMPSSIPGTLFSSMKAYHGYNFSFGMDHSDPPQLILVASTNNEILDLIPSKTLNDNLPASFVYDYIHWYNRQSGKVEFRPTESAWNSSNLNWHLENTGSTWVLKRPAQTLICPTSSTIKHICHILSPLEEETHIHIIRDNTTFALNISLPRLRLDFSLQQKSSEIHCRQFRGMYVDRVQQIGTLVGLQSKLTLRDDQNRRKVLVLNGDAHYSAFSGHVRVRAAYDGSVRVHPFDIDTRLGRLVDNGSLQSKLCLAYFHALTSYCLPDELTGKTGTEQCLFILSSAAVRSFQQLSEKDLDILAHISWLSPAREYYPKDKRVMEMIDWDSELSFLSQAGSLHNSVLSITEAVNQNKFFYPEQQAEHLIPNHVDNTLGLRHQMRASSFSVFGFGAESHNTSRDVRYKSRDRVKRNERSQRAFEIATMVVERRATIHIPISPTFNNDMWNLISNTSGTQGPNTPLLDKEVGYDCRWLSEANVVFSDYWCRFHHSFRNKWQSFCRFRLMFCLATMAYAEKHDASAVQALAACANISRIGSIAVPNVDMFDMSKGFQCNTSDIENSASNNLAPFYSSQEASLPRFRETDQELRERRYSAFETNQQAAIGVFVARLKEQWVCSIPLMPDAAEISRYVHTTDAMAHILPIWQNWYRNHQLFKYLTTLGDSLRLLNEKEIPMPRCADPLPAPSLVSRRAFVNQEDLFNYAPPTLAISSDSLVELLETQVADQETHDKLKQLIDFLKRHTTREFEHKYLQDLDDSQKSHKRTITSYTVKESGAILADTLGAYLSLCVANNDKIYCLLKEATGVNWKASVDTIQAYYTPSAASVATQFMAPRISPSFFLGQLARENWKTLSLGWKRAIVTYAQSLAMIQRAERMLSQRNNDTELVKELLNPGHTNWDPMDYPESLLLEVESGIMIREVQENIASQMRSPPQDENVTMQLNMGEGKSTVIVPDVAAYLADGKRLVCIIVTKPQAKELFRMLVSKLGGQMNHQIYQMPFSRSLKLTESDANTILQISKKCFETGGILLMQPEHLLSFKLMGIESQLTSRREIGQSLLDAQHYFNNHSRYIVDESDEIFSVKFELIYTIGTQKSIELSPDRWIIIQRVLGIVMRSIDSVRDELPQSIEISHSKKGQFSRIRILRQDAEDKLLSVLVEKICEDGFPGFPIMRKSQAVRECVREYILNSNLSTSQIKSVEVDSGFFTESIKGPLLLIRGLLAEGILNFAFRQKRWRVNYGLDLDRVPKTRLAVPYRAKDNPTASSEFSHPDVVIVLTCFTYYYGGLSDDDLFASFDHLSRADQAEAQYQEWVQDAPQLPKPFRSLAGVTMKDRQQAIQEIFPHFRLAKNAVDYFLAHIVFAKEMKEFPLKLSASGWDIGQRKAHPITGFSGTCDSRVLMPLDMKYLDLPEQRHTNALVLRYLLQPENSVAYVQKADGAQNSDAEVLLNLVIAMEPPVQVILDVGAQILELDNAQVAAAWLKMVPENQGKKAAIYFNHRDELCVIDQHGCVESLQTSPYNQQLDLCLVFLDEAHTRGTDLKLPTNYRAAVTLGPGLTKDRLVQACMRMRKLGKGQAVVFCISEEIQSRICKLKNSNGNDPIQVFDVLAWAISETFTELHRSIPMWAAQGRRSEKQRTIWESVTASSGIQLPLEKAEEFLEAEALCLDCRYRPCDIEEQPIQLGSSEENSRLEAIWSRCLEFDNTQLRSSVLWEEQERELSPEIVQERQIERPWPVQPEKHEIHPKLIELVTSGLLSRSAPFFPAFEGLRKTSAAQLLDISYFPNDVLITQDFMSTVILEGIGVTADYYQRSVQWVLSQALLDGTVERLIVISPHEAQELIPLISESKHVHLHPYAPLPSLAYTSLESLKLYTIPPLPENWHLPSRLRILLNLFSGQLYINSQDDYYEVCKLLNLSHKSTEDGVTVGPDGFIISQPNDTHEFKKSPIMFLETLLSIRWHSDINDKTHWGKILKGGLLEEEDFPESKYDSIID